MTTTPGPADLVLGIDASNISGGGGLTHLAQLLRSAEPSKHGFSRVVVWAPDPTLSALPDRSWLLKVQPAALAGGLLRRTLWQSARLAGAAREAGCDVLLVPGGSYVGGFSPAVVMNQNLLPFSPEEVRRYGISLTRLRLAALRWVQTWTLRTCGGAIFLTRHARDVVLAGVGPLRGFEPAVVPHGIDEVFLTQERTPARPGPGPLRLLYVSIVDCYKHQWHVARAVAQVRQETGLALHLDFVGPAYGPALRRLNRTLDEVDPERSWVRYGGPLPRADLPARYASADIGIFASSCENLPIILLEMMASGLPTACADRGPMREVLGHAGLYFDPEDVPAMAGAIRQLATDPGLRAQLSAAGRRAVEPYAWPRCAAETLTYLATVARR